MPGAANAMPGLPDPTKPFDRDTAERLFTELADELQRRRARAHVYIADGAAMAMAWRRDRTTRDVDGRVDGDHGAVTAAVREIAVRHGLAATWLEEQARHYLPAAPDRRAPVVFDSPHLVVTGASAAHLLAMKLEAARPADLADVRTLLGILEIRDAEQARAVHRDLFPDSRQGEQARRVLQGILAPRQRQGRDR